MIDFVKLCQEKNLPYLESGHHHCKEGWVQTHCPFCTDGTHGWHLGFSLDGGNMNCWRCGGHSAFKFIAAVFQNRSESAKQIFKQYQISNPIAKTTEHKLRKKKSPKPPQTGPLGKTHRRYLRERKFNSQVIWDWELSATKGLSGKWSWRIIAPICDADGSVIAWGGRAINPDVKPKWKFSANEDWTIEPKRAVYGLNKVPGDRILIVEGMSDCWRMGFGCVGVFGIDWKEEQASQLKNFQHRFIMFDPEKRAQVQARKLADWLSPFPGETEIISGLKSDPGELPQSEANHIMQELGF